MEKNSNTNANTVPETSTDQGRSRERSPTVASPPPPARNDDSNNPTHTVVIERSSSTLAAAPESTTTGDARRRHIVQTMLDVGTSSHKHVGGSSDAEPGKKRGRGDGREQQPVEAAKKKGELTEVPKGEPRCATCNKVFKSWKALFGHLRSHPERTYRGALPPPTAAELDIRQQLASTLLTVAQEVAATRRGLDIDLNQPSTAEDSDSPKRSGGLRFDLNVEPPPESDDEN